MHKEVNDSKRFRFNNESIMLSRQVGSVISLAAKLGNNKGEQLNGEISAIKELVDKFTLIEKQLKEKNKPLKE